MGTAFIGLVLDARGRTGGGWTIRNASTTNAIVIAITTIRPISLDHRE
jgi:hypothetical protein